MIYMKRYLILKFIVTLIIGACLFIGSSVHAQDDRLVTDFEHFYDDITLDKLSKLYWRMNKFDINDDTAVDNFLKINECDIYKEYIFNELEWKGVRERARNHLRENVESFPDRFKFEQPLRLGDYDPASKTFSIMPDYQIDGIRKFEVFSNDMDERHCKEDNYNRIYDIEGYPNALLVELNQPLNLTSVLVKESTASRYIEEKMNAFMQLHESRRQRDVMYSLRDAYVVMKIRVFSYKGTEQIHNGRQRATVYAMLEGYEIYADSEHEQLLYFENFIRKSEEKPFDVRLKEQFDKLKERRSQ